MDASQKPAGARNSSDPAKREYRLGVLALLVAVGTGGFTYMQYRAAEKAIGVAHVDSMQTMKLSNRPYVSVQGALDIETVNPRPRATVALHFSAMGASPALDAVVRRNCIASDTAVRQEGGVNVLVPPRDLWNHLHPAVSHSVLFPGTSVDFHCVADWEGDRPPFVFVVGDVTYHDVFKDAHKTTFCFEAATSGNRPATPMLPCSEGNAME